jgi:hypothetical protein
MSREDQDSGNGPVPGARCKVVPIAMARGPAEYTAGQQELPVRLTSLADMVQWAQNWARSHSIWPLGYDPVYAQRFWRILAQTQAVMQRYRTPFVGKSSPVHFFWGAFDLAVTLFSGRRAPERPGADRMIREAMSHEEISCGFWPGDDRFPAPAYYAFASPEPPGLPTAAIRPP